MGCTASLQSRPIFAANGKFLFQEEEEKENQTTMRVTNLDFW
jgi:hypothetical protein